MRAIGDSVDRDLQTVIRDEIKQAFLKLLLTESVFTLSREQFTSACASLLLRFQDRLTSGWDQMYFVYEGELLKCACVTPP